VGEFVLLGDNLIERVVGPRDIIGRELVMRERFDPVVVRLHLLLGEVGYAPCALGLGTTVRDCGL